MVLLRHEIRASLKMSDSILRARLNSRLSPASLLVRSQGSQTSTASIYTPNSSFALWDDKHRRILEVQQPGREIGDEESGAKQIRSWMSRIPSDNNLAIHDGSGLSRLNLVTPLATAQLLVAIQKSQAAHSFMDSLPISGVDGTLAGPTDESAGKGSRRKLAHLSTITAFPAMPQPPAARWLAFSIMSNDSVGKGGVIP